MTLNPGAYTAVVQGFSPTVTGVGLVELYDLHLTASRAGNISSRGQVLTGQNVLIAGFIVGGTQTKQVIVRAIGPSLATAGISNPLADPTLELHNGNGALLQSNDNWQQNNPNAQAIIQSRIGADTTARIGIARDAQSRQLHCDCSRRRERYRHCRRRSLRSQPGAAVIPRLRECS